MRVALLSHNARAGDAIGNQLAEKVAFFRERGALVRLFIEDDACLHPELRSVAQSVPRIDAPGEGWQFLTGSDLVVVEFGQYYPALSLLPRLARGPARVLLDYHGLTPLAYWDTHNREGLELGFLNQGLAWFADAVIAHSHFTGGELQEQTGLPADRLHLLGHVIDSKRFRPRDPTGSLRTELNLGDARLLLFVGRMAPNKRVPVLIEALHELRDLSPPVHAVLIGDAGDVYGAELACCRQRAAELGVSDRLHFLGRVSEERLADAYRSADVFVMPSRHEGFCIPVVEAMACAVPVVAARAGALPETVGPAGLTFAPDDVGDLARQVRRVLAAESPSAARLVGPRLRVAVVCYRWGADLVGGAERSLRTIATALGEAGHSVEVFTTCNRAESNWANHLPAGTAIEDGVPVHRFPIDVGDRQGHLESFRAILEADGPVSPDIEAAYLEHSVQSRGLLESLGARLTEFDAILVGPYLFGLTHDVARTFSDRVLLLPCFHDEPLARLGAWRDTYEQVGGILYHSPEEQAFAERELGINHPGAALVGTVLDSLHPGDPEKGRLHVGGSRRYLVYCGRYSAQKNVHLLLEHFRRYESRFSSRFALVFLGQGEVLIPREPWVRDMGFVEEERKQDFLAGADALVQLSHYESLSLVALEAWVQGTPVLAHRSCAALAGLVRRAGGGVAVSDYERFEAALNDLWEAPNRWRRYGSRGREFVRAGYTNRKAFADRLLAAIRGLKLPLAERLRQRGRERGAEHDRSLWRERFGRIVEDLVHAPEAPWRFEVTVEPRTESRSAAIGQGTVLIPVRVTNLGTHPLVPEGSERTVLRPQLHNEAGEPCPGVQPPSPVPGLVLPGQAQTAAVSVAIPTRPGRYEVSFRAECSSGATSAPAVEVAGRKPLRLTVEEAGARDDRGFCAPVLAEVQKALAEARRRERLPESYTDISTGWLVSCKRWVKHKLLNNFKRGYVDVLSRQQSGFNRQVVTALQELVECCELLSRRPEVGVASESLRAELVELREHNLALESRIAELEAMLRGHGACRSDGHTLSSEADSS
jgi:glycosyltransferase involved in cell wall biosynthesis